MPIEVIVTPIWTAEMYSLTLPSCSSASAGAPRAFLAHQFEPRPARAHERVLGDHEERVDRDQQRRDDQLQAVAHADPEPWRVGRARGHRRRPARGPVRARLLRGSSSSSFIALRRPLKGSKRHASEAPVRGVAQTRRIESSRELEVGVGEPALRVRGEREADLVPAVDEDVRVVVLLLGDLGDAVDEGDRRREVRERQISRVDRAAVARRPAARARAGAPGSPLRSARVICSQLIQTAGGA